jgi:hypothetical protein
MESNKSREFVVNRKTNGNIYIGEMIGDVRDGKGKNIWRNGDTYEGEWLEGKHHGWG